MRKRRAARFFGGLTLLILAYVAWCSREMYLPVEIPSLSEVPEDALPLVLQEIEATGFGRPEKFDFETFLYRLSDPIDPHPVQSQISMAVGERIVGFRTDRGLVFWFRKENGGWLRMDPKAF